MTPQKPAKLPYRCPICRLPILSLRGVYNHMRTAHPTAAKPTREACVDPDYIPEPPKPLGGAVIGINGGGVGIRRMGDKYISVVNGKLRRKEKQT